MTGVATGNAARRGHPLQHVPARGRHRPLVRVEEAGLGPDAQVRLVVSGISDLARLQRAWASSGATLEARGERLRATTSVQALARAAGRALPTDDAKSLEEALETAIESWLGAAPQMPLPSGKALALDTRPAIVGVVNITEDSFSDGGRLYPEGHPEAGIASARALLAEGADVLDIGGESTRPGSQPIPADEERRRVLPVLEPLVAEGAICSIDTTKPEIAGEAVAAGAQIVNDVSGARDPAMLQVVAETGAAYVLMHTRGTPADMQRRTDYDDVVAEVYEFLADGLERCIAAGVSRSRILVDPGIGFAKTAEQNLTLLRTLRQLRGLGSAVFVGASRKSFLGTLSSMDPEDPAPPGDRLEASLACAALAVAHGAAMVRVHDVAATIRTARVSRAISMGQQDWPPVLKESS